MSLPHYDFGEPRQLTPEMLEAALIVRLNDEIVTWEHRCRIMAAAQILRLNVGPPGYWPFTFGSIYAIADQVLLAWPEG